MERITGHYDKIVLTLIMCLVILFMATFSPFAESAKAVAIVDDAIIAIVILALSALGITFITTGAFDTTKEYVSDLMTQYAEASNTTVYDQLKGVQTGSNKLGQILVNNRFVVYIQGFASFIKALLHLSDNATQTLVSPGATINGLVGYTLPMFFVPAAYGGWEIYIASSQATTVVYFVEDSDGAAPSYAPYFVGSSSFTVTRIAYNSKGEVKDSNTYESRPYNNTGWFVCTNSIGYRASLEGGYAHCTDEDFYYALDHADTIIFGNTEITVKTGDITLPYDDTDYTDGDGAVIDLDAPWGIGYDDLTDDVIPDEYSDSKEGTASIEYVAEDEVAEAVEDTSEITNLPAGTIPFTPLQLPQFHLVDIWHYVADWIEDTAIAAGALMAIVVQEPHPMVNLFYATVCLAIIFGLIKGLAK